MNQMLDLELGRIYSGKNVMVLGGAGFIGSHLMQYLGYLGANPTGVDNFSRGRYRMAFDYLNTDVTNENTLVAAILSVQPFAVFNLAAAVAGVDYNQEHNLGMFQKNIGVLTTPVKVCQDIGVNHLLQVSSACVYAPGYTDPCKEENGQLGEPVKANNGYSWAKRLGERAAIWSSIPHVVVVRPSNCYGPRDYYDDIGHVIPKMIRRAFDERRIFVIGGGSIKREFIHVKDLVRGMAASMALGGDRECYNLGTNGKTITTTRELAGMLVEIIREYIPDVHIEEKEASMDQGDMIRWSSCELASNNLGWSSNIGLYDGLVDTVEEYARTIGMAK